MKRLLILTVLLAVVNAQTAERNGRAQPRVEIIIPSNTNLFLRTSPTTFVFRAGNDFSFGSFNRTNVIAGSTNRLNSVGLTNPGLSTPTSSLLIGPVFPAPVTNFFPTGRSTGFEGLDPVPALVTNAFGQVTNVFGQVTNSLTGSEVPASAVPSTPPNATPLAPPTAPGIPQPTTPSSLPNPNSPPSTPSSPNPTPPNTTPLTPPNSAPPTPPAPPPAAPGAGAGSAAPR